MHPSHRSREAGFTLVEILVVLAIILLVSVIALPAVWSALNGRQVTDAARIFTGALVGARDSAIRHNVPRGIRLLPDPILTVPAPGSSTTAGVATAGLTQLAYNRMIAIEPAPPYSEGRLSIGPQLQSGASVADFPPRYYYPGQPAPEVFPFPPTGTTPSVLMVEESLFAGGFSSRTGMPNAPTNWYWNVRIGDKIRLGETGHLYTIVGPCTVHPLGVGANYGNFEMYVNVGPPGTPPPIQRSYYGPPPTFAPLPISPLPRPEFLFLVDGMDNDDDGWVDEGTDTINNNPVWTPPPGSPWIGTPMDNVIDDLPEWETETWKGRQAQTDLADTPNPPDPRTPSTQWVAAFYAAGSQDLSYKILRRPVPSPGAREIPLPGGTVIDATTWNTTQERSRLPVEPGTLYCDIMVDPRGNFVPSMPYSSPTPLSNLRFLHFWITEASDVHPRGSVWGLGAGNVPNPNPNPGATPPQFYELPMTTDAFGPAATNYPPTSNPTAPVLKGDRRLVTMFTRNGLIVTNPVINVPEAGMIPGEGFHVNDVNWPYRKAEQGQREAR